MSEDITERKRAEEDLKTLSSVVEQSMNSIAIINQKDIIEYANPKFCEFLQINPEDVVGQEWLSILSEESRLSHQTHADQIHEPKQIFRVGIQREYDLVGGNRRVMD